MNKKIKEIFENNGIFNIFATYFQSEFETIFGDTTAETLDNLVLFRYGNFYGVQNLTENTAANVIVSIITIYLPAWLKINTLLNANYDVTKPISETKTKTGTLQRSENSTNTRVTAEKAFNDTDFVSDSQNTDTNSGLNTDSYNLTETKTANESSNITYLIENNIYMRKRQNLYNEIIETIIKEIAIKVY